MTALLVLQCASASSADDGLNASLDDLASTDEQ